MADGPDAGKFADPDAIKIITATEHIRLRPGMYIGALGVRGWHQLAENAMGHALAEASAKRGTTMVVTLHADASLSITDDGNGLPVLPFDADGVSRLQQILTTLYTGGRSFLTPSTLCLVWVNALSKWFDVDVQVEGERYRLHCIRGVPGPLERLGPCAGHGTTLHFMPDRQILGEDARPDAMVLANRLRELACLNPGLDIRFQDRSAGQEIQSFTATSGMADLLEHHNRGREPLHPCIRLSTDDATAGVTLDVALQFVAKPSGHLLSFVNNLPITTGTHLTKLRDALVTVFTQWIPPGSRAAARRRADLHDYCANLSAAVKIVTPEPQFSGPSRDNLINPEVGRAVKNLVEPAMVAWCQDHPGSAMEVLRRAHTKSPRRPGGRRS